MTRSAREVIAKHLGDDVYWRTSHYPDQDADRILARLSEMGYVVVPREPTPAMLDAGLDRFDSYVNLEGVWSAMLDAIDGKDK